MNTYLGAAQNLTPADLDEKQIAAAGDHLSGRLSVGSAAGEGSVPQGGDRSRTAPDRMVALTLSDAFCVGRYRDEFLNLMRTGAVDLIFANESELKSLYETSDFDAAHRGAAQRRQARRGDAQREGLRRRLAREQRGRARPRRSTSSSTRPARATCSRPASSSGLRADRTTATAARLGAHRGGRSDPASRRAARDLAEGARAGHRLHAYEGLRPLMLESPMQPLKVTVVPVTPFQQNCSIVACTATNRAAIVDPGGDVARIREAIDQLKVEPEKILLTHGHLDHAGGAAELAEALSLPIEGPDERDAFLLDESRGAGRALRHHRHAQRQADALAGRRRDRERRRPDLQRAARSRSHARASGVRECAGTLRAGRRHAVPGLGRPHRFSLWQSPSNSSTASRPSCCRSATT